MRIIPTIAPSAPEAVTAQKPRAQAQGTAAPAPASIVRLSSAGASASVPTTEHDATARVAQIKAQLANGTYPIDRDRLASRIVDDDFLPGGSA